VFNVYFPGRTVLLALSEGLLSVLTLLAAMYIWFGKDVDLALLYDHGLLRVLFASTLCVLCMYYYDLYDSFVMRAFREVVSRVVHVLGTVCIILAVVYYAYPPAELNRGPLIIWMGLGGTMVLAWRRLYVSLTMSSPLRDRSILLGDGPLAVPLADEIARNPEFGLNLVGYVGSGRSIRGSLSALSCLGTIEELSEVVKREQVSCVIISTEDRLPAETRLSLTKRGVQLQEAPKFYEALTGKMPVCSLRPGWLLLSRPFGVSRWIVMYKGVASIILSVLGLIVSLPVMILVALAIRLDSPGPVMFKQRRIGKNGREFTLYKFRSMHVESDDHRPAEKDDGRVTRVGHWIRRCRLDELPQLFNILRGEMHFVGPRPCMVSAEEECARLIPFYDQRWTIEPGLTGWAQIKCGYCSTVEENVEKLSYDLFYIKHMSPGLDCLILFHTIKILLLGRGAR
jgi:exopolysaccharide biosynthesis polyprenyl glycosylphosphotransferase